MQATFIALILTVGASASNLGTDGSGDSIGCVNCSCRGESAGNNYHCLGDAIRRYYQAWFGPMPQSCYGPRYGCYGVNQRTVQRYPAFHGYYYRRPYNYRHLFDYKWHVAQHEPSSLFSYRTSHGDGAGEDVPNLTVTPRDHGAHVHSGYRQAQNAFRPQQQNVQRQHSLKSVLQSGRQSQYIQR